MTRRGLWDRVGVYRRDGKLKIGRAPYITDEQWAKVENPNRTTQLLQRLGLAYAPDRTRRKLFGGRTTD